MLCFVFRFLFCFFVCCNGCVGGGVVASLTFWACFGLVFCFGLVLEVLVVATLTCCVASFVDSRMLSVRDLFWLLYRCGLFSRVVVLGCGCMWMLRPCLSTVVSAACTGSARLVRSRAKCRVPDFSLGQLRRSACGNAGEGSDFKLRDPLQDSKRTASRRQKGKGFLWFRAGSRELRLQSRLPKQPCPKVSRRGRPAGLRVICLHPNFSLGN